MTFYCSKCKKYFSGESPICPFCGESNYNTESDSYSDKLMPENNYKYISNEMLDENDYKADSSQSFYPFNASKHQPINDNCYETQNHVDQDQLIKRIIIYGAFADVFCYTVILAILGIIFAIMCLAQVSNYKKLYGPLPAKLQFLYITCIIGIVFGSGIFIVFSYCYGSCLSSCSAFSNLFYTTGY
ncbi:MAG: hypothetical protein IJH32_00620 [Ruminococcus sp.]|nr:hypothetical protein [Ruminococcus sp.]